MNDPIDLKSLNAHPGDAWLPQPQVLSSEDGVINAAAAIEIELPAFDSQAYDRVILALDGTQGRRGAESALIDGQATHVTLDKDSLEAGQYASVLCGQSCPEPSSVYAPKKIIPDISHIPLLFVIAEPCS